MLRSSDAQARPHPDRPRPALGDRRRWSANFTVHRLWEAADRAAFLAGQAGTRFLASTGGKIDAALMDALPALEVIANFGVGVDAIDLAAARARGIRVTNTPDVLNQAVAELTLALMLALCRRIVDADAHVRAGRWPAGGYRADRRTDRHHRRHPRPRPDRQGDRPPLPGLRHAGGLPRPHASRSSSPISTTTTSPRWPATADWLVCVVPGDTGTRGMVSREVLAALGPKGAVVNVGRGPLIDEAAMLEMLRDGSLGGAALDVFADEPQMDPGFWALPNVVLSPHQGSATEKTRWQMGDLMVRNLIAWRDGHPLISPVV